MLGRNESKIACDLNRNSPLSPRFSITRVKDIQYDSSFFAEMTYEKELHIGENSVSLAILDTAGNVSMFHLT